MPREDFEVTLSVLVCNKSLENVEAENNSHVITSHGFCGSGSQEGFIWEDWGLSCSCSLTVAHAGQWWAVWAFLSIPTISVLYHVENQQRLVWVSLHCGSRMAVGWFTGCLKALSDLFQQTREKPHHL